MDRKYRNIFKNIQYFRYCDQECAMYMHAELQIDILNINSEPVVKLKDMNKESAMNFVYSKKRCFVTTKFVIFGV